MMAAKEVDTFNKFAKDSPSFWETYSRGRPRVPSSFWRRLANYHSQHGNGKFTHVRDLGSGPGIHAPALAKHFNFVTLTDPSDKSIEAASAYLSQRSDGKRYAFQIGRAEDRVGTEDLDRYDMVFLGNSLHWMEMERTMENVASSLCEGGTVVAVLFGLPDVTDQKALQAIHEWLHHGVDLVIEQNRPSSFGEAMIAQDSDYDSVNMDTSLWENVTRLKLNRDIPGSRGLTTDKLLQTYNVKSELIEPNNVVRESDSDWYLLTDLSGLREIIGSFPIPTTPEEDKKLWDILNSVYESKPVEIHYGVSIILATKRPET